MIINIPERVLLIKVTRISDVESRPAGYILIFHDITDAVSTETPESTDRNQRRRLNKIPTASDNHVVLVDTEKILHLYSDGHYSWVVTAEGASFCNLSISDIEARLDPDVFMRVHRSHIVNIGAVKAVSREGSRVVVQVIDGGAGVPVSRTSAPALLQRLGVTNMVTTGRHP
nr:LytTR family DNA-binding domain-containing protein [Caballeronia sp. dw_19]